MKREEALRLLGLDSAACELTPAIVTTAFRRKVLATHPDRVSPGDSNWTPCDMDLLTKAKETLLGDTKQADLTCPQCAGRGTVRHRMGVKPCGACQGTGERNGRG